MTMQRFSPSPLLADATTRALQHLARHWPRSFVLLRDTSEAGTGFVNDYAFALSGLPLQAIEAAAQQWVRDFKFPPSPSELSSVAKNIARQMREADGTKTPAHKPPPIATKRRDDLVSVIANVAHDQLGKWSLVSEMWALLYHNAKTSEEQLAVYSGELPAHIVDEAIAAIKDGKRAPHGPMKILKRSGASPTTTKE